MKEMNIEDFGAELQRLAKESLLGVERGVNEVAEDLGATSQKLAPLLEGGLMENASVESAVNVSGTFTAKVGYNKKYALIRHEGFYNLGSTSASKPGIDGMTVGRKFLAQPLTVYRDKYMKHIADRMQGEKQ